MHQLTLSLFMFFACAIQAAAEPTSIRCDGKYYQQQQPYFVTYDLKTNHFVYERVGGNIVTGEITAATDAQLDFSLRATGGRILFLFDRQRNVMTWPGMPDGELGRPALRHACTEVSGRTMLSTFWPSEQFDPKPREAVDAFSLTCPGQIKPFFITLDRVTKSVIMETEGSMLLSGNITSIDDGVIRFTFPSAQIDVLWDERTLSLTAARISGDVAGPATVTKCAVIKPRSIMVYYDEWARWGK
jgi:hypothetical protein